MADLSNAQQKRAEARRRRRKAEPEPEGASENPPSQADGRDTGQGVRQAAKVAAAIGAAGAAAAAAKVLASHGDEKTDEQDAESRAPEHEPAAEERSEPQDAPESDEPQASAEPEPEAQEETEAERDEPPVQGARVGDARRAIDRARGQLEDLLGRPVEEVSSLERTHDGWVLALEVVELQRIPETTDVLASYELELDDDLNLRRYGQTRRYHRGHTDSADDR
jgi:hypothetical protein